MFGLDAGILERKEQLWKRVLEQWGSEQGSDCHVATSPRRDVSTSRRQLEICTLSFKVRMVQKSRYRGEGTNAGTDFQSRVTQTSRECLGFVPLFIFWIFSDIRMMFSLLNIFIVSFIMF